MGPACRGDDSIALFYVTLGIMPSVHRRHADLMNCREVLKRVMTDPEIHESIVAADVSEHFTYFELIVSPYAQ